MDNHYNRGPGDASDGQESLNFDEYLEFDAEDQEVSVFLLWHCLLDAC